MVACEELVRFRVGTLQANALEVYIFDPAHEEDPFPGTFEGGVLTVDDAKIYVALDLLTHAQNSADEDKDRPFREALSRVWWRIARELESPKKAGKP
jgi:hypothetical protein